MFPRGLVVAVSVGAAAGILFGIAIELNGNDDIRIRTDGASVTIVTEERTYAQGEGILVTVYNSGTIGIDFEAGTYYGLRITQLDGILVYAPEPGDSASHLGAGQGAEIVWPQTKTNGEQVHAGIYRILAEGTSIDGDAVRDSTTVNILG